jgi:hypothetical protein
VYTRFLLRKSSLFASIIDKRNQKIAHTVSNLQDKALPQQNKHNNKKEQETTRHLINYF